MVTQAKLQINDPENIEGETFNNLLSFSVDMLVWTMCFSKGINMEVAGLVQFLLVRSAFFYSSKH